MLLTIKNLSFSRDYDRLFEGVQLIIEQGEWVVIRGKNGTGKSTLLKLIAGVLSPDEGEITPAETAFLGHQNGQRPYLTVEDQLKLKKQLLGSTRDLNHIMDICTLTPLALLKISKLSAGQQRQVALAGILLSPAPLWLLDEPFEHLDAEAFDRYMKLCHQHVQAGGAICQTSHRNLPSHLKVREVWLHG